MGMILILFACDDRCIAFPQEENQLLNYESKTVQSLGNATDQHVVHSRSDGPFGDRIIGCRRYHR